MKLKDIKPSIREEYKKITKKLKRTTPTRYNRILNYIKNLRETIEIKTKRDQEIVDEIENLAKNLIKKLEKYYNFNLFLYLIMYFSFISYIFRDVIFLSEVAQIISKIVGVLGTTIFFIALYVSNKIIELYYQDLNLLTSHLISVYSKHQKEIVDDLTTQGNYYKEFIKFFEKRY